MNKHEKFIIIDNDGEAIKAHPGDTMPMSFDTWKEAEANRMAGVTAGVYTWDDKQGNPQCHVKPMSVPMLIATVADDMRISDIIVIDQDTICMDDEGTVGWSYHNIAYAYLDMDDKLVIRSNDGCRSNGSAQQLARTAIDNRIEQLKLRYPNSAE